VNGDGCSSTCNFENTKSCITSPIGYTYCHNLLCGNGNLDPGEMCDDGNLINGDSCSISCTFCGNNGVNAPE